jgi:hypothetical protein
MRPDTPRRIQRAWGWGSEQAEEATAPCTEDERSAQPEQNSAKAITEQLASAHQC